MAHPKCGPLSFSASANAFSVPGLRFFCSHHAFHEANSSPVSVKANAAAYGLVRFQMAMNPKQADAGLTVWQGAPQPKPQTKFYDYRR